MATKDSSSKTTKGSSLKIEWIYSAILAVAFLISYTQIFDDKLFVGGDNATYYILGKSLADGNGYTNVDRVSQSPANHFPPGYPAIISVVMRVMGQDFEPIKVLNGLFLLGSLVILMFFIRELTNNLHLAFAGAFVLLFNFHLLQYSTWMMSETSFLFFSTLSLWLLSKASDEQGKPFFKNPYFYGFVLSMVVTYYIRSVGLALVGAALFYWLIQKKWLPAIGTVVGFVLLALPWYIRGQNLGGVNYLKQLSQKNPYNPKEGMMEGFGDWMERFGTQVERYIAVLIPNGLFGIDGTSPNSEITSGDWLWGLIILAGIIFGIWKLQKAQWLVFAYLGGSFLILCLWPEAWYDYRFMVPLIPILLLLFLNGVLQAIVLLAQKQKIQLAPKSLRYVSYGALLLVPVFNSELEGLKEMSETGYPPAFRNYFAMGEWAKNNTPDSAVVACRKGNLFYMFSERRTFGIPARFSEEELIDKYKEMGVDYVVIDAMYGTASQILGPIINNNPQMFTPVHQFGAPKTYMFKTNFDLASKKKPLEELNQNPNQE